MVLLPSRHHHCQMDVLSASPYKSVPVPGSPLPADTVPVHLTNYWHILHSPHRQTPSRYDNIPTDIFQIQILSLLAAMAVSAVHSLITPLPLLLLSGNMRQNLLMAFQSNFLSYPSILLSHDLPLGNYETTILHPFFNLSLAVHCHC